MAATAKRLALFELTRVQNMGRKIYPNGISSSLGSSDKDKRLRRIFSSLPMSHPKPFPGKWAAKKKALSRKRRNAR